MGWVIYLGMVLGIGGGYVLTVLVGGVLDLVHEKRRKP